jgi:hypothetical protein
VSEIIELHMKKRLSNNRTLVDITVVRPLQPGESFRSRGTRHQLCQKICRELRGYLMIG